MFSKKLEIIEKYDSETWAKLKPLVENESQMTWIAKFFEELNKKHQDAADQKRKELAAQAQKISKKLAKELAANPMLDIKKTDKYREIAKIQEKIQNVGFTPDQSVLDEGMYQAAALKVFGEYIDHTSVHVQIERPAPAPKKPSPSDDLRIKTYVAERDATYVKPPVIPTQSQMDQVYMDRGNRVAELGKLFSLLGFGEELFSKLRANPKLAGCGSFQFSTIESLYPKPDSGIRAKLNSAVKETARINKVSALSEISRTAQSQKLLAEIVMADVYSRTP
ncbi:hypothetical protein EBZ37_15045, partial [bacterium]|nr:hypothetical protein [bacterium]